MIYYVWLPKLDKVVQIMTTICINSDLSCTITVIVGCGSELKSCASMSDKKAPKKGAYEQQDVLSVYLSFQTEINHILQALG